MYCYLQITVQHEVRVYVLDALEDLAHDVLRSQAAEHGHGGAVSCPCEHSAAVPGVPELQR